ncbi:Uncharacterized protein dnm_099660 [Desulfonema magnum]|uniref:Uncharacterized protein n=1 Tax=Desulfonema magnum TaxID=45655 RepID=A0A975BZV2_9BACT|nr:Uncharacterized protein dnm_099660 [Desulfonema magnum]
MRWVPLRSTHPTFPHFRVFYFWENPLLVYDTGEICENKIFALLKGER